MANGSTKPSQLIPPPDLAPPRVKHLPLEKRIEIWAALVDESDALVRAGLRAKIGPNGDLHAAYRDWYARKMEEHQQVLYAFAENLSRLEAARKESAYEHSSLDEASS